MITSRKEFTKKAMLNLILKDEIPFAQITKRRSIPLFNDGRIEIVLIQTKDTLEYIGK